MIQGIKYTVDIVLCIDATGSMSPVISAVKTGALRFYEDLLNEMSKKSKAIDALRLKVIVFRDFYCDGDKSFSESPFFNLPADKTAFASFVNPIEATGGGDEPECGLEAIASAIKSNWNKVGDKKRQVIVLWTDASAHPLEKAGKPSNYPKNIAKNFDELVDDWEGGEKMNDSAKRFLLFAPDAYPWTEIATNWSNTIHYSSTAGAGLSDVDYNEILQAIANSV